MFICVGTYVRVYFYLPCCIYSIQNEISLRRPVVRMGVAYAAGRAAVEQLLCGGTWPPPDKNWSTRQVDLIWNRI